VVISTHCASHNRSMGAGQVAEKISPGDQIFDRPVRVSKLLAALEPEPEPEQADAEGGARAEAAHRMIAAEVVRCERLATDSELTIAGTTSQKYIKFLGQRSRALQKKQALAEKWEPGCVEWACECQRSEGCCEIEP
jgi:hypothetical protein